ncbi:hypothetical protein E4U32_000287 [Claviceps aff. humidiphila group G2b]|nr:hypothetical protein E4U32_000287 [Claviceps aff. humidiphila group G2b]
MKASSFWGAANVVLSTSAASHSLAATQLRATGIAPLPEYGAPFPKPTPPPQPGDSHQDLVKKTAALETLITMMIVPDNTCGWVSALITAPYICARGDTCGLVLAQPTGAVMCYNVNDETYDFALSCIDYSSYFSSSSCDYACNHNTYVRKCTDSSFPYCVTYDFLGGITAYRCNSISQPAQAVLTSWRQDGEIGRKTYSKFVKFVLPFSGHIDLTPIPNSAVVASLTNTGAATGATFGSSVVASPTTTSAATGADAGSSGGDNSAKDGSKTPVGAIVGGVIGGVAAIGAGLLITFFCLRRRNSRTAGTTETPPSTNQPSMQPMASPGMSMTQKQVPAFYDSHSNHGSEPLQTYPASAQQYSRTTPSPQGGYFSQPSLDSSSPTVSKIAEFRISQMAASPTPTSTDAYGAPAPGQQLYAQQTQSGDSQAVQDQQQQKQRIQGYQPQIHQPPLETPVHEVAA